jgi:flagellar P-ring protein precursor FlgI
MTPLKGADGKVYAMAQGPVSVGGFTVVGGGDSATKNHPTVARMSRGGVVERAIPFDLFASGQVRVVLRSPDFVTVTRVQAAINKALGSSKAKAIDSASVIVPLDETLGSSPIHLIAKLERLNIEPDSPARVVVNEKTGTIIMGENVRVSTVALAHGNLNVTIRSEAQVSQPEALGQGETVEVENTDVSVAEETGKLNLVEAAVSLGDVVHGLNNLGATPRDLIAILQALEKAGALHADLVVM